MFHFVFFVFLSLTSTQFVDALSCATNCTYSGSINNPGIPSCDVVDKPANEHSCQVILKIDYVSGAITGQLNARTPPTVPNFDALTDFSLYNDASNVTIQYDCVDADQCDLFFVKEVLSGDWTKVQNRVKILRNVLTGILFNSSDLRPNDTCPSNQPCSGEGFCQLLVQLWSDSISPKIASTCANSTEQPVLEWLQAYDQTKTGEILLYICNEPSCASQSVAQALIKMISSDYVLPFNVTMPPVTTSASTVSTPTASMSTPTVSMSTTTTAPKSAADSGFMEKTRTIIYAFASFLFLYLF